MNADRSHPGSQRPLEAPQSSGGFDDAPTAAPSEPAPSTPVASRDLLLVRFALHNGFIDQATLDNALAQQQADPSRSLAEILVRGGSIPEEVRQAIEILCQQHVAKHGGGPQQRLNSLSMPSTVSYRQPPEAETVTFSQKPADSKQPQGTFGDYELLGEIARGGMGVVYKARQTKLNRLVALKMIKAGELADTAQVRRFYAEAGAVAKLDHRGIVPVYEVGEANGQHFYSMAFVAGRSLNDSVKKDGPLTPIPAAELIKAVAEAVQFAHEKGIVHRDIKPQNILLDENEQPRVADFGLAKQVEAPAELTMTGQVIGTPSYMPPEQAAGAIRDIGPVSDVYSLGATLYFLLTGRPPFQTASAAETIRQVIEAEPVPIRRLNQAIPRDLETICLKCLRKEPAKRYATAADLADDLGRWLENKPIVARPVGRGERAWLWCKRRPAVASLLAAMVIISVVGSLVAVETRNATIAAGLIDSLQHADADGVKPVLQQLGSYRRWATPSLVALAGAEAKSVDERRAQLHARMALVARDERQVSPLVEELLAGQVSYVGVIRDQLAPYQQQFKLDLWALLHDGTKDASRRFRAGLALAGCAAESEQWTPADSAFLVEQLVAANPDHQPRLREYLRPLNNRLLDEIERIFADPKATESQQLSAANALADFAGKDTVRLASLLSAATPGQYEILYPLVTQARDAAAQELLDQLVRETPTAELSQVERVALGQRRAGSAITLLRQGERESILDVLRVQEDAESLTQFIHRCRQRGILPPQLLECLKLADQLRQTKTGEARRTEDRVLYALVLALGEFELADMPADQRGALVEQLAKWYANDQSSTIHGATGWLLRHWKQDELTRKVDQTPIPYTPEREWFTLQFKHKADGPLGLLAREQAFYVTFVVFPADEYLIGSAPDEADRQLYEPRHAVKLTRPIAVSDREISWEQFNPFDDRRHHDLWEKRFERTLTPEEPAFGVTWYEAVAYCRWMTERAGMAEDDQAYADRASLDRERFPADPDPEADGAPRNWPVNLVKRGFRLPTEAEWETVCRGGTNTAYSFGNDVPLLGRYGWFMASSDKWSHAVGRLRPSARGLFDIHGNLHEWCHDWMGDYRIDAGVEDPAGPAAGSTRVHRGGGWYDVAKYGRSANRVYSQPAIRDNAVGFRIAVVPSSQRSESASEAGSDVGSGSREAK